MTLRQQIMEAITGASKSARELAHLLRIPEREVEAHLVHIEKSVGGRRGQPDGRRFRLEPASCSDCGFVFRDRTRLTTPSRCPTCRSEQIVPPRYRITLPSPESRRDE